MRISDWSSDVCSSDLRRSMCQASAWLLEVTGLPSFCSTRSTMRATRRLVQATKTASHSAVEPMSRMACSMDSAEMRATVLSSGSLKEPMTGMSMPRAIREARSECLIAARSEENTYELQSLMRTSMEALCM